MRFVHPSHPGRCVRLAYCLNVHPAEDVDGLLEGLDSITAPLRDRVAPNSEFGIGMYLSGPVARRLVDDERELARLRAALERRRFDPFTYNAFPYGGFGESGLKQRVFEPAWWERERAQYTLDVATIAARLRSPDRRDSPLSISTHTGAHASAAPPEQRAGRIASCWRSWSEVCETLASRVGPRVVLALEPEPDSLFGSVQALSAGAQLVALVSAFAARRPALSSTLGVCLDACHAAVMFEDPAATVARATSFGPGVAKLQFTSALTLRDPAANATGRAALFALDEPRYLHQLAALTGDGDVRLAADLPDARARFETGDAALRDALEWRCHFHVPVDLSELGDLGLGVTVQYADELLDRLLERPENWIEGELHVEIETYTWSILPREARGAGERVDGLEREYRHVIDRLTRRGWRAETT